MTKTSVIRCAPATPEKSPFAAGVKAAAPFTLTIFGATGDLAGRKLFPALFNLWRNKFLPERFAVIGVGRRPKSDEDFRNEVRQAVEPLQPSTERGAADGRDFLDHVHYQDGDISGTKGLQGLAARLPRVEADHQLPGNRLFYLATDPNFFAPAVEGLAAAGLVKREVENPWSRVVIEKPYGRDLASAVELDRRVLRFLRPDQVYRIDHYLGKETVQNLLAFRFGNAIFEPLFSRHYVDHVQITMAETVGMEGQRGSYYDHAGALRDVVQNHLLQVLALVAMDPPATLRAGDISDAKLRVLRCLAPIQGDDVVRLAVRGQYGAGTIDGEAVPAYRDEGGVAKDSQTETFVALRAEVENWRWAGVPFLLRTGKRLPKRATEVAVQFKLPPLHLFHTVECEGDFCDLTAAQPSVLVFRIQPDEGISLSFSTKRPGMQFVLEPVRFEFDYDQAFDHALPEAYERLLFDALRGDATLFMRSDELEAAWEFITPILEGWQNQPEVPFPNYAAGAWGPADAKRLADCCPGGWRLL